MTALPSLRAQQALIRALRPVAGPFAVIAASSRDWSSATFEGARHRLALALALEGEDRDDRVGRLVAALPEADLALPGGFVADLVVAARDADGRPVLAVEALTIRDGVAEARAALSAGARRSG